MSESWTMRKPSNFLGSRARRTETFSTMMEFASARASRATLERLPARSRNGVGDFAAAFRRWESLTFFCLVPRIINKLRRTWMHENAAVEYKVRLIYLDNE